MIVSRTPLRISLVGGGTDMPAFYTRHGGAVVSMAIDKYVYVILNKKFDGRTRVSYSETENVEKVADLKHDLIRETLATFHLEGYEVVTVADIPGGGTGLGSSSALTVGLLNAISRINVSCGHTPSFLASEAFTIESQICKHVVGKQDHYASAYGALHYFAFNRNDTVTVEPLILSDSQRHYMQNHMLLLWTGITRSASTILNEQSANLRHQRIVEDGSDMVGIAETMRYDIRGGYFGNIGKLLHENWMLKKSLANGISNPELDQIYLNAINAGAEGGKICGAGGGGFFLFWADPAHHVKIIASTGLQKVGFAIEKKGAQVIYDDTRQQCLVPGS